MNRLPRSTPCRRLGLALLACALPLLSGCLTFEKETMVFVFPPGSKEVPGLLVYEGLRVAGTGPGPQDLAQAREQLERLFAGNHDFCLGHPWLLHGRLRAPEI